MERHSRPNTCTNTSCHTPGFGNKADLLRHEREVHGLHGFTKIPCPFITCRRHTKGFTRKQHLDSHIRNRHKASSKGLGTEQDDQVSETSSVPDGDNIEGLGSVVVGEMGCVKRTSSDMTGLRLRLEEKEAKKRDLDKDILALKRVIRVLDDVS